MTTRPDPSHLISGHATDALSAAEMRRLYRAALDDQEIFDRLVEEESWRQLLVAPGVREQLLETLAEPAQKAGGWRGWFEGLRVQPLALGAAAAALLAVVMAPRWLELGVTGPLDPGASPPSAAAPPAVSPPAVAPGATSPPPEFVAKSFGGASPSGSRGLEPKSTGSDILELSYTLELNQPDGSRQVPDSYAFRPGDQFRLRVGVDFAAWVYLFNRAAGDADYAVLYPHTDAERGPLPASEEGVPLPAGVWLTMDDTPEDEELVLVVASEPWSPASGREALPASELGTALEHAESSFASLNWRRSEVDGRVRLEVEESDGLVAVMRLLAPPSP